MVASVYLHHVCSNVREHRLLLDADTNSHATRTCTYANTHTHTHTHTYTNLIGGQLLDVFIK